MLLFLFRLLSHLPLSLLQGLGRLVGRLVYALPTKYRQRLRANAAQAGYDSPAFARRAAGETGAMILELARVWFRSDDSLARVRSSPEDEAMIAALHAQGRGVLYLTPHLGCFEITARYRVRRHPLTVMFRPPRKAALAPVMQLARESAGMKVVPANQSGVRAFVRALRQGEDIGMLPDQAPGEGEGVWAPFFGRQAYSVTLPARLARQTNAPVVLVAGERLPKGAGWQMHYVPVPEPLPESPEAQATLINQTMESLIRRCPEQYLWGYNRYKTPKGAPAAPGALPSGDAA
ncbi:Lipid A biosynthesis lauroyl acyltransferase [plant metagenome]